MGKASEKAAIMDLYCAYADGVNRHDGDIWIACWEKDAVWQIRDRTISGAGDIRTAWEAAMASYSGVSFFFQPGRIEVEGRRARARILTLEFLRTASGEPRTQIGEYDDDLIRRKGRWRFARRVFRLRDLR